MKYKVKKVGDFESNIEIDIDFEDLESKKDEAISKISKSLKVKGFRPGKIPKNIVIREVGEDYILEESIDLYLPEQIFEIASSFLVSRSSKSILISILFSKSPTFFNLYFIYLLINVG